MIIAGYERRHSKDPIKGDPHYAQYYAEVDRVEVSGLLSVTFFFKPQASKELLLILGQLPVLSEAFWKDRDFTESTLDIPLPRPVSELQTGA